MCFLNITFLSIDLCDSSINFCLSLICVIAQHFFFINWLVWFFSFYFCVHSWLLHVIHNIRTFVIILHRQFLYIYFVDLLFLSFLKITCCPFLICVIHRHRFVIFLLLLWFYFCCPSLICMIHPFYSLWIPHDFFVCLWFVWFLGTLVLWFAAPVIPEQILLQILNLCNSSTWPWCPLLFPAILLDCFVVLS